MASVAPVAQPTLVNRDHGRSWRRAGVIGHTVRLPRYQTAKGRVLSLLSVV